MEIFEGFSPSYTVTGHLSNSKFPEIMQKFLSILD